MLYFEWKEEDAIKYAKEEGFEDGLELGLERGMAVGKAEGRAEGVAYGAEQNRKEVIRKFAKKLAPEDIAETLQVPKQYVLDVLKDDGPIMACEPISEYKSSK